MKELLREELTKMRSLMKLNEDLIKLSDGDYEYIEIDDDISGDLINRALLDDLEQAAQTVGLKPKITTVKTDHPSAQTGKGSRHKSNQAVDVSVIDGRNSGGANSSTTGNSQFREKGNKLKDALVKMGYVWNPDDENAHPKVIFWQTNTGGNHFNHLHVSNTGEKSEGSKTSEEDGYNVFGEKEPSENIGKILNFAKKQGLGKFFGKAGRMLGLGESVEQPREKLYDLITFYRPLRKEQNTEE